MLGSADMIWLTRDTLPNGSLAPWIDVWDTEPERHTDYHPNGAAWTGRQRSLRGHIGPLDVRGCIAEFGVAPESDSASIAIGPNGKELS